MKTKPESERPFLPFARWLMPATPENLVEQVEVAYLILRVLENLKVPAAKLT
jgi:hypothetical protein